MMLLLPEAVVEKKLIEMEKMKISKNNNLILD